jgi:hypothetical protein
LKKYKEISKKILKGEEEMKVKKEEIRKVN